MSQRKKFEQEDADKALMRLAEAADELACSVYNAGNLETPPTTDEDEEIYADPIYDGFVGNQSDPDDCLKKLTNFTEEQFGILVDLVSETMSHTIYSGRGKKCQDSPRDLLFMLLVVLKQGGEWSFMATLFKKRVSTFEKLMSRLILSIVDILKDRFIVSVKNDSCTMENLAAKKRQFKHFPHALYATDVKFHHTNRPQGNQLESKLYYSGKHHLYGYKVEVSVSPLGFALHISKHYPGSKADISIFRQEMENHKLFTKKSNGAISAVNSVPLQSSAQSWAILFDKGYTAIEKEVVAEVPKKKPPKQSLTTVEKKRNAEIAADRIIVENWFGRLVGLWGIFFKQYRWSEEKYDDLFMVCSALTNFHISFYPLRDDDLDMSMNARKKLYAIGISASEKKRVAQMRYRENRKKKLRSYLDRGAQSSHLNGGIALEHISANQHGRAPGADDIVDSEEGVETESDNESSTLSLLHI